MEERDWRILRTLNEYKNITKAARELFISQPALTNRLQQMEDYFKIKIVNRGSRGVQFTPEGEYLAAFANEMLLQLRKTREKLLNFDESVKGTLRIGASRFLGKYKLPRLLSLFKKRYPEVDFSITTSWSHHILDLLYNQQVHVGFIRGEHHWLGCKELLFQEDICIASTFKIDLENLPNLPRILYQTEYSTQVMLNNWWLDNYSHPPQIVAEVDSLDTCKEMILSGLGYAILTANIVSTPEDLYRIKIVDKQGNPLIRNNWLFYHEEALELNTVRAFVNFAKEFDYLENRPSA